MATRRSTANLTRPKNANLGSSSTLFGSSRSNALSNGIFRRKTTPYAGLLVLLGAIAIVGLVFQRPEVSGSVPSQINMDVPNQNNYKNVEKGTGTSSQLVDHNMAGQIREMKTKHNNYRLVTQADLITSSPNTVVTGYFSLKSKFAKESYLTWMSHMLSLQDAMIIFTSPDMVPTIQEFRSHAKNRTVIVPMSLDQVEIVRLYKPHFWEAQLKQDPERRIHRSYQLFWIWLSKSFLVTEAIALDIFKSDVYMWSDIGCFRNAKYRFKEMIQQRQNIPKDRILQMAHHDPQPPPYIWWNDKYTQKALFYHSGSQMVGYRDTWLVFHAEFLKTIRGFVDRKMFIGEDQTVLQSTCLRLPHLCAYVPFKQVRDNHYFGLRFVLHVPNQKYNYWYPPSGLPAEKTDVDSSLLKPMKEPPSPPKRVFKMA